MMRFKKSACKLTQQAKLFILFIWLSLCSLTQAETENVDYSESDQELLDELMAIVDESTAIATQTRMNANSVPGIVSVLDGAEMESLGMRSVWDALSWVPGLMTTRDGSGISLTARGLSFPFSSGNIKVLLNSKSMSQESSGINSTILQIPIEQVERIEVVRGPGAVVYGDNAFMGLVNIITKSDENRVFSRFESNGAIAGGANGVYLDERNKVKVAANVYAFDHQSATTPNDRFASEDRQFGVFSLQYKDLAISAQSYHRDYDLRDRNKIREGSDAITLQQSWAFSNELKSDWSFAYSQNDYQLERNDFSGNRFEGGVDLHWSGWRSHQFWLKFSYVDEHIDQARMQRARPSQFNRPPPPLRLNDVTRTYYSISLQDQFEVTEDLTITASLRFDHRDDIKEDFFTPRVSAVWRINDEHILKAQYAEGFRAPTFFEFYPNPQHNLNQETIETTELSYIHHQANYTGKVVFFYSHIDNMIYPFRERFNNDKEAESFGVELEWMQQLTPYFKWQANVSYVDSWDTRNRNNSRSGDPTAASWLSNIALFYKPMEKIMITARWNYVGERNNSTTDVDAVHRLDLTLNATDLFDSGFSLKLGVNNLFSDQRHHLLNLPVSGATLLDYGNQADVWLQLSYKH